jgi:Cytochrome bd-type quinol oxidase, subunit 2
VFLTVGYSFIGATWVIHKTDGALQGKSVDWAKGWNLGVVLGIGLISAATPLVSTRIFDKWFSWPEALLLSPLPVLSALLVFALWWMLRRMPFSNDRLSWLPFAAASSLWVMAFIGMAYSFLSLCGSRKADDLRSRKRTRKPVHHPDRHAVRAAHDPGLYGAGLYRVPRQGDELRYD